MTQRPRLSGKRLAAYNHITKKESRILVIGDLHCPFDLDEYFDFCKQTYEKWNCNQTILIGDVIDNHYSSYHETSISDELLTGGQELELAIERLQRYYKEFPVADVILGNHDRLISRKSQTSAIPSKWIKSYKEVRSSFLEFY